MGNREAIISLAGITESIVHTYKTEYFKGDDTRYISKQYRYRNW